MAHTHEQLARIAPSRPAAAQPVTRGRTVASGPVFKRIRRARRMTREQLAMKAGLAPAYIRELENGRMQPSSTTLVKLADGLGVSLIVARAILRVGGAS